MLEVIPTLMLWLCMPLDATPQLPPVRAADLAYFPAAARARVEAEEASRRRNFAAAEYKRVYRWGSEGERLERFWFNARRDAVDAYCDWAALQNAHARSPDSDEGAAYYLGLLRNQIGPLNYYHGQMPAPVYTPGIPPAKAGDK